MVYEQLKERGSQWEAIRAISSKIGCSAQTLSRWVRRDEIDSGKRPGGATEVSARIKTLEREQKELRRANEILRMAYFGKVAKDRDET